MRRGGFFDDAKTTPTLTSNGEAHSGFRDEHGLVPIAFDSTQITSPDNRCNPQPGDPCHPLASGAHPPSIAFSGRSRGAEPAVNRAARPPHAIVEATGSLDATKPWNVAHALTAGGHDASEDGTGRGTPLVECAMAVRRLTPTECLRLMGWPDDHFDGLGFYDSTKYKICGNGIVRQCSEWIGKRIVRHVSKP